MKIQGSIPYILMQIQTPNSCKYTFSLWHIWICDMQKNNWIIFVNIVLYMWSRYTSHIEIFKCYNFFPEYLISSSSIKMLIPWLKSKWLNLQWVTHTWRIHLYVVGQNGYVWFLPVCVYIDKPNRTASENFVARLSLTAKHHDISIFATNNLITWRTRYTQSGFA